MIATISAQPIRMSHRHHYANASAGPLPTIPRRTSSRQGSLPLAASIHSQKRPTEIPSTMQRSYSSGSESDRTCNPSTPSSQAPLTIRARRVRSAQAQGRVPAELAKVIPPLSRPHIDTSVGGLRPSSTEDNITISAAQKPMPYTPGTSLRRGFERSRSTDSTRSAPASANTDDSRIIRKKSGQPVKPSLKTSRSLTAEGSVSMFSKSEPATPICKAVHFDSQLEHVKLFLAEQKPLAVSRDGSPTDDTSGTDSDFPSFIFGGDSDKRSRMKLVLRVVNMPSQMDHRAEVCLEEVTLSTGNHAILGRVRVRNIAYAKSVGVRFTFDSWQTTSEVVAHYLDSPSAHVDRFSFNIKLDDLLARIDEKTLVFAVRYAVAGQEYWDNNRGADYVVKFSRTGPRDRSLSDDESPENIVRLQHKLEKVVESKDRTGPAFSTALTRSSPRSSPEHEQPLFKSNTVFGARYDLNASFKQPWKYQDAQPAPAPSHRRNNSFPQFVAPKPTAPPCLPSPRDTPDGLMLTNVSTSSSTIEGLPVETPTQGRNHRRGYFDLNGFGAVNVRRTPPTSPPPEVASPSSGTSTPLDRSHSFPPFTAAKSSSPEPSPLRPTLSTANLFSLDGGFDSELSTPSLMTPTSSRSTTPSPTEPFLALPSLSDEESPTHSDTHYRALINQYCFFTGAQDTVSLDFSPTNGLRQSELPVADSTPKAVYQPRMQSISPLSSPLSSTDDLISLGDGSLTPTRSRMDLLDESRSPTPTAAPLS